MRSQPVSGPGAAGRPPVDVAVIGGGIVGLATAAHLAGIGASVLLVEREAIGAGASGRNSGVVQQPFDEVLAPLYEESLRLYRDLERQGIPGLSLPSEPAGLLLVSRHEPSVRAIAHDLSDRFPALAPAVLDEAELHELEPGLEAGTVACRVPIGYPVTPGAPAYAYATHAERLGVRIRLGHPASVALAGERAIGVVVRGQLQPAGAVVVAAGPWTPESIDPTGRWQPITPLWGVVVEVLLRAAPRHVLEEAEMDEALGTGSLADQVAAPGGAAPEPAGPRPQFSLITAAGVSTVGSTFLDAEPVLRDWEVPILERASQFVPAIADAQIRDVHACARPATADGRPLLGRVPGIDRLFVAAGHGPWGISTGPASGRLVADLVAGRPVRIPPEVDAARAGSPLDAPVRARRGAGAG